jgi:hypothetical protein
LGLAGEVDRMSRWTRILSAATVALLLAASLEGANDWTWGRSQALYDGRFTFVRLRWGGGSGFGGGFGRFRGFSSAWDHDFPRAEQNLMQLLKELTLIPANTEGSLILSLTDPDLFKFPIVMMWEPGFWSLTDQEAIRFREYLLKGGFAIFDDFEEGQWNNLEAQMRRVLPEAQWVKLDKSHRIFDTFFRMNTIDFPHPSYGILPNYYGIHEDNDPSKRLMVIANHNNDVAEYWEFAGEGFFPVDDSNEAYKLGVNYMLYGMTH